MQHFQADPGPIFKLVACEIILRDKRVTCEINNEANHFEVNIFKIVTTKLGLNDADSKGSGSPTLRGIAALKTTTSYHLSCGEVP